MILPDIRRVVRFDAMVGKTIKEVREGATSVRLIFTDDTFADIESEDSRVIVYKKPSNREKRRARQERG